jgi:hypothetical protein
MSSIVEHSYEWALVWGLVILAAFAGWGALLDRLLFRARRADWAERAVWGLAFCVVAGGFFNLAALISPRAMVLLLVAGCVSCLIEVFACWPSSVDSLRTGLQALRRDRWAFGAATLILVLTIVHYLGWASVQLRPNPEARFAATLNIHDDLQAYVVFPTKMLQTGSLGKDPFSERRLNASLGGQWFLHTLVLAVLPLRHVHLLDPALALLMYIGLLIGYAQHRGAPQRAVVTVILLLLLIPIPILNASAVGTGMVLYLGLFRATNPQRAAENEYASNAIVIALMTAALCALKSSLIAACGLLVGGSYIQRLLANPRNRAVIARELALSTVLTIGFLLPWMLAMHASSGTLLYPLFGRGYHGTTAGTLTTSGTTTVGQVVVTLGLTLLSVGAENLGRAAPFVGLAVLAVAAWRGRHHEPAASAPVVVLATSALAGIIVVALLTENYDAWRFAFPFSTGALLVLLLHLFTSGIQEVNRFVPAIVVASLLAGTAWDRTRYTYLTLFANIHNRTAASAAVPRAVVSQYRRLQDRVPPGEPILTRLEMPFLLDFRRNPILIVDSPGGASLPPGMPSFAGPEPLADYLVAQSIRYVAYSYSSEAQTSRREYRSQAGPDAHPWIRALFEKTFDFQDNLAELGTTRRRLYDDSDIFVLDLLQPSPGKRQALSGIRSEHGP